MRYAHGHNRRMTDEEKLHRDHQRIVARIRAIPNREATL